MFDAWGNLVKLQNATGQFVINNGQTLIANYKMLSERGFTGHEHLFGIGLINMNGRLYDPKLHRFLMPDNNLQDPSNSQNFNRYAYVLNNPLMNIDPSGEEGGGPGDGGGIPNNCANCGLTNTQQTAIGNGLLFIKDNWDDWGIKDWSNRNLNFNKWNDAYNTGTNFIEKNVNSLLNDIYEFFGGNSKKAQPLNYQPATSSFSFAPSGGTSSYVSSVSTSPGGGYNSAVEMHPYASIGISQYDFNKKMATGACTPMEFSSPFFSWSWAFKGIGYAWNGLFNTAISTSAEASSSIYSVANGGGRAFWSGAGSEAKALAQGFGTLGKTKAGENLIKLTEGMPYYPAMNGQPASQAYQWWARLSTQYAKGASGTINVFQNAQQGVSMNSIWRLYEYPTLIQNPNVTGIIFH